MDLELSDEQRLVRETARAFTDREVWDRARQNARDEHFDRELVGKLAEQGYLGATVPREYGGAGLDHLTYGLVVEEIGRGDCEWLGCFALTEPDTGSDAANQRTRARRVDGGWVIDGAKMWISMGNHAKVTLVFAPTDPDLEHRGLACFLVDTEQDGFRPTPIHGKMGLHGSDTASLALDGVEVRDEDLLGEVGDGFKVAMSALDSGRYSVAAGCVGICRGCVEESVRYAQEREQFGQPIGSFQLVQAMLADMHVQTEAARGLVWKAAWLKDQGRPNTTETSVAKLFATEAAVACANTAIQVHGGAGYVDDHPVERWFRDVRVTTLYEGTSQIQKLIIGRALTGLNALVPG